MEHSKVFDELIDDLFAEHLPSSNSEWYGEFVDSKPNLKRWAVVGFNYDKAKQIIESIEQSCGKDVLYRKRTRYELLTAFTDGTLLRWCRASDSSRGFKFNKMWCDKEIDKNIFNCVIRPCYMGNREDIIWL